MVTSSRPFSLSFHHKIQTWPWPGAAARNASTFQNGHFLQCRGNEEEGTGRGENG